MSLASNGSTAEDLAAVWLRLPGPELAQAVALLRRACHLSRDGLAARLSAASTEVVGVDAATIWRWEAGRQAPRAAYRLLLGRVTERELARVDPDTRREVLRELAMLAGLTLLPRVTGLLPNWTDADRFTDALARPGRVDGPLLNDLASVTRMFAAKAQTVAPAAVLPLVGDHLEHLRRLMEGSHPEAIRRRLEVLSAEAATVAGRLAFWKDDRGQAADLFGLAGSLAHQGGEPQLRALVLAFQADLWSGVPYLGTLGGNTTVALTLFDEAASLDAPDWSPLLRSWVLACRAEELAELGEATASDRDLDAAQSASDLAHATDGDVVDIAVLDISAAAAGLTGFRGACALSLGRAEDAIAAFEEGLAEETSVGRLSGLAAAYALRDDLDRAVVLLTEGLEMAVRRRLPTRVRRIDGVRRRYLARWAADPAVRRFDERFRGLTA